MTITLYVFGGLRLEDRTGPLAGRVVQRLRLALLALIAVAPGRVLSRDKVMSLLWPEASADEARHCLSTALYEIRRALGSDAVVARGADLWLNPAVVATDLDRFRDALAARDPEEAVRFYAGPFLDGFHVSANGELERWVENVRTQLARAHATSLQQMARAREAQADLEGAAEAWRQLVAIQPHSGRATLELMRVLDVAGERASAIRCAMEHASFMRAEFGTDLDPEVTAFAEELRSRATVSEPGRGAPRRWAVRPREAAGSG